MRETKHQRLATSNQRLATSDGIILLPFIGVLAIITILGTIILPDLPSVLEQKREQTERHHLKTIADGVELYVRTNRAWPANLAALANPYVSMEATQLAQNPNGFPRYFFAHPDTASFSNGAGLPSTAIADTRFLLLSNLAADAAPTITNATQFETWWDTVETSTLHIYKGNVADEFPQVTLSATGKGGSFQIDGTATSSSGGTLTAYSQHHMFGTMVLLDEASTFATPEVEFALTEDVTFVYVPCLPSGRKWVVPPAPPCPVLWVSTIGNASGATGIGSWTDAQVVSFVDPNLTYENGPTGHTNGTFGNVMDLEDFTGSADIDAGHYVGGDITVGGVALLEGDLLLSTESSETLNSLNSLSVADEDVFIFRPATDDYSSGTFIMFFDGNDVFANGEDCDEGALPICDLEGFTLVETATTVGGQALAAGDLLLTGQSRNVWRFTPTSLGTSTSGSSALLIDGNDINISQEWDGIELIEVETTIGDITLQAGQILGTLGANDSSVGNNSIAVNAQDVFILDLTSTGADTAGTATLMFDGSEVGLSTSNEVLDMIALNGNGGAGASGVPLTITNADFETGDLTGWTKTGDLYGNGGTNRWGVENHSWAVSTPHGGTYLAHGEYQSGSTGSNDHLTGIYQRVDVSAQATEIDAGGVTVTLNGYGFGHGTGPDAGFIRIAFYDQVSGGSQLGSNVESSQVTIATWTALSIAGQAVPTGTRSIEIILLGEKPDSGDQWTDTGFDDLSGALTIP